MTLVEQPSVESFLEGRHVRFEVAPHIGTYTARSEARALGLPAEYVLKVVMLRQDDGFVMAVVPASRMVDMNLLMAVVPDPKLRLATEDEIASAFPGYELGALPPLPGLLGVRAIVDSTVFDHEEIAFADGKQIESIIASPRELFWGEDVYVAPISRKPEVWGPWELQEDHGSA